jgi:adenylate cyclase
MTTGSLPDELGPPWYMSRAIRPVAQHLPSNPRCQLCYYPFEGLGGSLARRVLGVERSKMNPHMCNHCERLAEDFPGGAEIETTVLFADVRGSTTLAEGMRPAEFGELIGRFYSVAAAIMYDHDGLLEKLIGDEVTGFFVPGVAGPGHAGRAVQAAQAILRATGHGQAERPWVPVGVGVHSGLAYIGAVRAESGSPEIVVLGDTANTGARLASAAGPGEVLVSEAARAAAGLDTEGREARRLTLKGRTEPVTVWVLPPS